MHCLWRPNWFQGQKMLIVMVDTFSLARMQKNMVFKAYGSDLWCANEAPSAVMIPYFGHPLATVVLDSDSGSGSRLQYSTIRSVDVIYNSNTACKLD